MSNVVCRHSARKYHKKDAGSAACLFFCVFLKCRHSTYEC
ncbi:hypothetical protein DESPIG_01490 [Desulfovibrio piger ATCC 29098]|uniref:Uncharacterized protein n=1 Tax=Desulfovibrio piger ATCC 29098 TaxID=411464 RepID=B6WTT2_9BACT|nr:hypothetical protein DESPIG_01490 [Desulfovibrio piger ATCC 29098]